jgi:hypothetical protein
MEKNLEWFLRRNFGLTGEYNSPAYKEAEAITDEQRRMDAFDAILEKSGPEGYYSKEAWDAWERALKMVDDLVEMGILDDDGSDSPASDIRTGFCDLS